MGGAGQPQVAAPAPVAERIRRIDPSWYSEVLRRSGDSEAAVTGVEAEAMAFAGAAADIARVRLTYDESGAPGPASVVAKMRGADEVRAAMDAAMGLHDRETRVYSELADRLPVATPRCYHAGDGTETPLLIEDLGAERMGDMMGGLSLEDAERIVEALADLHASHWEAVPEGTAEWLVNPGEGSYPATLAQLVAGGAPVLSERLAGQVGDGVLAAVAEHASRWDEVLRRCAEGPPTLGHNDCRLDNIFFRADGEPVFVDWQIAARIRGTADVANLLGGSMDAELSGESWAPLLRRYHDRLCERGVSGYSWLECVDHYRVSALHSLVTGIALIGSLDSTDERGVGELTALRALRHVEDLDSFEAL